MLQSLILPTDELHEILVIMGRVSFKLRSEVP